MKIAILGGGSWGSALAVHLAKKRNSIKIWEFFAEQAQKMQQQRICPLLPDVKLPDNILISSNMNEVLSDCELILIVVPSDKVEPTILQAASFINQQPIIICSKGFSKNLTLLSEVVQSNVKSPVFCLYGPTHAEEVGKGLFSGIVLAGKGNKKKLKSILESDDLKVELSTDIIGVQVSSALKNLAAIFIGILDGLNLGDNAKAYVMTKCLEEIKQLGKKWGAQEKTFYGLAGIGDLIVTCTSQHSRNRYVGEQVGKGRKLDEVIAEMKMVAEGLTILKTAIHLQEKFNLNLPLITGLHQILFEGKKPEEVLRQL